MRKVLVILPTYNERDNIRTVIDAIFKVGRQLTATTFSVLVVDDNSPDGTAKIVRELQKSQSRLSVITGSKKGLGKAYLRGFRHALKRGAYDIFIMMDADLSHDPAAIPQLIRSLDKGNDYAIGSRYVNGGSVPDWPIMRVLLSRAANWLTRRLIGVREIRDMTSGFKAIRVTAMRRISLADIKASGYFFQVNLLYEFWRHNLRISEVPITFTDRHFGTSKLRLTDVVEFIYRVSKLKK